MKSRRIITATLLIGIAVSTAVSSSVIAQELTPTQTSQIQTNCQSIKSVLNQLHVSDALLRVNRGQLYESIATKLMDRFNTRVASSDFEADTFQTIASNFRSDLTKFRTDYVDYERQLSRVIAIDCQENPTEFNSALVVARELRFKVRDDIERLNQHISDYQRAVNDFYASYQQLTSGGDE
jgi:hypothetical protein